VASFDEVLSLLPATENPKQTLFDGVPCVLHEDHRWLLPIAYFAQRNNLLPQACTVVMFDRHTDAIDPYKRAGDELGRLRQDPNLQGIVSLCSDALMKNDADWLKAGMQLGLFGDAIIFGAYDGDSEIYTDHIGNEHRIKMSASLPQHTLSDALKFDELQSMWDIVGWKVTCKDGSFLPDRPKILLTIDLDCFAIEWGEYVFAWPDKIFEGEYSNRARIGWSGREYLEGLAKKAGLIAIARESECCGGSEDAEDILQNLIHYGFSDRLSF
jgi:hypothetical protein